MEEAIAKVGGWSFNQAAGKGLHSAAHTRSALACPAACARRRAHTHRSLGRRNTTSAATVTTYVGWWRLSHWWLCFTGNMPSVGHIIQLQRQGGTQRGCAQQGSVGCCRDSLARRVFVSVSTSHACAPDLRALHARTAAAQRSVVSGIDWHFPHAGGVWRRRPLVATAASFAGYRGFAVQRTAAYGLVCHGVSNQSRRHACLTNAGCQPGWTTKRRGARFVFGWAFMQGCWDSPLAWHSCLHHMWSWFGSQPGGNTS
jgi:hypothetical protein